MEASASARVKVLSGTHKGKTGVLVSKTDHYTKIRVADDTVIRCKNAFAEEIQGHDMGDHDMVGEGMGGHGMGDHGMGGHDMNDEDDILLQEILIASLMEQEQAQKEKEYKQAAQHSEMIQTQNAEYEQSLKQDIMAQEKAKKLVFEEVDPEEMRRIRLIRFG